MGADELSLGDTIGVGPPAEVQRLVGAYRDAGVPLDRIGVHFHDTYGQGLANVLAALELGVTTVDASTGGIGGSPVAKQGAGHLATQGLLWLPDGFGINPRGHLRQPPAI